jgi:hypothetical protein
VKCANPNCNDGFEIVFVLLDSPQEIYVLAKHLPNSKPHIAEKRVPCRICYPKGHERAMNAVSRSVVTGEQDG